MSGFDAEKYLKAQEGTYGSYEKALAEIKRGRKTSHWIWYIFPQIAGLGFSSTSHHYALGSLDEAKAYLANKVLRGRLIEMSEALLRQEGSAESILGHVDAVKVRSCMTLFREAARGESGADPGTEVFDKVLDKFYGGKADEKTLKILQRQQKPEKSGSW